MRCRPATRAGHATDGGHGWPRRDCARAQGPERTLVAGSRWLPRGSTQSERTRTRAPTHTTASRGTYRVLQQQLRLWHASLCHPRPPTRGVESGGHVLRETYEPNQQRERRREHKRQSSVLGREPGRLGTFLFFRTNESLRKHIFPKSENGIATVTC